MQNNHSNKKKRLSDLAKLGVNISRLILPNTSKEMERRERISIFFLGLILGNVEVTQLIDTTVLVGCNDPQPIPHIVLLQVLLG